jgi:YD repeat-containing protein
VDVKLGPDGALYVSDDHGGRIWRVSFIGSDERTTRTDAGSERR